jgi:hypothetical protein
LRLGSGPELLLFGEFCGFRVDPSYSEKGINATTSFDTASASACGSRQTSEAGSSAEASSFPLSKSVVSSHPPAFLVVDVECYAGHRGEETPRRFRLGDRAIEIAEVLDRWLAPDHRYFKVKDTDGDLYILRHDVVTAVWEVAWFRSGAYPQ